MTANNNTASNTIAQDTKLGKLLVTKAYEGKGGIQIVLDHQSTLSLLEAAGFGQVSEEDGEQVFTPQAVKRDQPILLSVTTPKGRKGQLVWGDTHALHASHQTDQDFFALILNAARTQAFELAVTNAEPTTIRKNKKGNQAMTLSTDIC